MVNTIYEENRMKRKLVVKNMKENEEKKMKK